MNKKKIAIILSSIIIFIIVGLTGFNYYKNTDVRNANEFILNIENGNINKCIELLDNSNINPNYVLDGETLYNKTVNIVLEKSADPINGTTKYLDIFDKMDSTARKSSVKLYNNTLNSYQLNFLGAIGVDSPNKKSIATNSSKNISTSVETANSNHFTMDELELLEKSVSKDGRYIQGKIKNNNVFSCSYVEVKAKITDTNGNVLDTSIDNITSLKSGETWSFSIPVIVDTSNPYNYEIIEMQCNPK